jgi:hypothetical protein
LFPTPFRLARSNAPVLPLIILQAPNLAAFPVRTTDSSPTSKSTDTGKFENDKEHGKGTMYSEERYYDIGQVKDYEGQFENGEFHGSGISYVTAKLIASDRYTVQKQYEGQWQEGCPHGKGTMFAGEGIRLYEGDWEDGERQGNGNSYFDGDPQEEGGVEYAGKWCHDMRGGGFCTYKNDTGEIGEVGEGTSYYPGGGKEYEGGWMWDKMHGTGTLYDADGAVISKGEFDEGTGISYHADGKTMKYEGGWRFGKMHGTGTLYTKDGGVEYRGGCKGRFERAVIGYGTSYYPRREDFGVQHGCHRQVTNCFLHTTYLPILFDNKLR